MPGNSAASVLIQQIESGVMAGQFASDEITTVKNWINSLTNPGGPPMNRFQQVVQILDDSVGNADFGAHGRFWLGKSRDEFVGLTIFGQQLLIVNDGANSNLVKALKAEAPFGADQATPGAFFDRMPGGGRDPVSDASIAIIENWIDDGCPDVDAPADGDEFDMAAGGPADAAVHNNYWRDFDDWAMFNRPPEVATAINQFFSVATRWMDFAKDPAQEPDWDAALADSDTKDAVELLAGRMRDTMRSHYGAPVEFLTLLDSYERFGDDSLPDDPLRPVDVRHNMNGATMWFFWSSFTDAALRLDENDAFWLGHSRALLLGLMNDGLFRERFTVNGFTADDPGKADMRTHVRNLQDDDIQAELIKTVCRIGLLTSHHQLT